jgi:TetR/AcrR family transcriptional regulator
LSFVESVLSAMAERPLAPALLMLESVRERGQHFRKLGMPSLYAKIETLLKKGIATGEFRQMDPWHGAINIVGLCGFYYVAANNFSHAREGSNPLSGSALKKHTAEVMAFVKQGVIAKK